MPRKWSTEFGIFVECLGAELMQTATYPIYSIYQRDHTICNVLGVIVVSQVLENEYTQLRERERERERERGHHSIIYSLV